MDPRAAVARYIRQLVDEVTGIKALLLDAETANILGLVFSQSDLLEREVLLTEKIDAKGTKDLAHMKAIVFVRPIAENIFALRHELRNPRFASYKLIFSNLVKRTFVEEIADADQFELVSEVKEVFADYYASDSHLISFDVLPCMDAMQGRGGSLQNPLFERTVDGITATILSMKIKPRVRFQASSPLCKNIAERLCVRMDQEASLFDFRPRQSAPLLLIIDRREDPVTPLLNQWTYEAMVHELIGIKHNRVSLENAPKVPDDFRELVLDSMEDLFFRQNRYKNFGDLGVNLKTLVDSFQVASESSNNMSTIEDMMRFVGNYPEFRKASSNVSKHVALAGELSRLVGETNLLDVSQLEQDLACREGEAEHRREILQALEKKNVTLSDKLRLVMLYSLRYEESRNRGLALMKEALMKSGVGAEGIHLITAVKEYAGAAKRSGDVFSNRSFFAMASNRVRRGIGGVDNVYTQHEPLLVFTIDELLRGKLRAGEFPLAQAEEDGGGYVAGTEHGAVLHVPAPREVLILIAGGVTYEESKCISAINGGPDGFVAPEGSTTASAASAARQLNARVVLIGSCIHNSTSFAVEISRNASAEKQEHIFRSSR